MTLTWTFSGCFTSGWASLACSHSSPCRKPVGIPVIGFSFPMSRLSHCLSSQADYIDTCVLRFLKFMIQCKQKSVICPMQRWVEGPTARRLIVEYIHVSSCSGSGQCGLISDLLAHKLDMKTIPLKERVNKLQILETHLKLSAMPL